MKCWFSSSNIVNSSNDNATLCMNPGPIEFDNRVLKALDHKGISHVDPAFIKIFSECLSMMRSVFCASSDSQPMILTGSGTLGWDMVGSNLLNPNDHVLVVNTGYFGDKFGDCLKVYGAHVTHLSSQTLGGQPTLAQLEAQLKKHKYKMVTLTHVDTSTGVLVQLEKMAATIRKVLPDALIVVDSVCALGGEECRMADWDLDVVLTGSQKAIGVPAGLSLLVVSARALRAFDSRKGAPTSYYANWHNWLPIMRNYEGSRPSYFATPAVNHIYSLHVALQLLLEKGGMEARWKEHSAVSDAIKAAVTALGCGQVPVTHTDGAHTMTCVRFPSGVKGSDLLPKMTSYGISLSGGLHAKIKSEYFRIGHMGLSSRTYSHILKTIEALEKALRDCGHEFKAGAGVEKIKCLKGVLPSKHCPFSFKKPSCGGGCPVPTACQFLTLSIVGSAVAIGFVVGCALGKSRS